MKTYLKAIFCIFAALAMFSLTACGSSGSDEPKKDTTLVGSWYLSEEEVEKDVILPVLPNANNEVENMVFTENGDLTSIDFDDDICFPDQKYTQTGTKPNEPQHLKWSLGEGKLLVTNKEGDSDSTKYSLDGNILTLYFEELDEEYKPTGVLLKSIFTKNNPKYKNGINPNLLGIWYLNKENNIPVKPNKNNKVNSYVFTEDGRFTCIDFETDESDPTYIQTTEKSDTYSGTWNCENEKIRITGKGEPTFIDYSISGDVLSIVGEDIDTHEIIISEYKRTIPSL